MAQIQLSNPKTKRRSKPNGRHPQLERDPVSAIARSFTPSGFGLLPVLGVQPLDFFTFTSGQYAQKWPVEANTSLPWH
jgi:hypothetical protein